MSESNNYPGIFIRYLFLAGKDHESAVWDRKGVFQAFTVSCFLQPHHNICCFCWFFAGTCAQIYCHNACVGLIHLAVFQLWWTFPVTTFVLHNFQCFLQASKKVLDPVAPIYKYCLISVSNILTTTCQYEVSVILSIGLQTHKKLLILMVIS